jgi:hypothetical protein
MLLRALAASPQIDPYAEGDPRLFTRYRLSSPEAVVRTVRASRQEVVLLKPLCDSHDLPALLSLFAGESPRGLWLWRDVDARARSAVRKFGPTNQRVLARLAAEGRRRELARRRRHARDPGGDPGHRPRPPRPALRGRIVLVAANRALFQQGPGRPARRGEVGQLCRCARRPPGSADRHLWAPWDRTRPGDVVRRLGSTHRRGKVGHGKRTPARTQSPRPLRRADGPGCAPPPPPRADARPLGRTPRARPAEWDHRGRRAARRRQRLPARPGLVASTRRRGRERRHCPIPAPAPRPGGGDRCAGRPSPRPHLHRLASRTRRGPRTRRRRRADAVVRRRGPGRRRHPGSARRPGNAPALPGLVARHSRCRRAPDPHPGDLSAGPRRRGSAAVLAHLAPGDRLPGGHVVGAQPRRDPDHPPRPGPGRDRRVGVCRGRPRPSRRHGGTRPPPRLARPLATTEGPGRAAYARVVATPHPRRRAQPGHARARGHRRQLPARRVGDGGPLRQPDRQCPSAARSCSGP